MSVERYNARTAEIRWQQIWGTQNVFAGGSRDPPPGYGATPTSPSPPCGRVSGLHANDLRRCTMADVVARYKRACGVNMQPLPQRPCRPPAESAALAVLRSLGLSFDFSPAVAVGDQGRSSCGRQAACHKLPLQTSAGERFDIDPSEIIDTYGADATRWFVLSDSPPDRDTAWSETGLRGAWRFVQRLWRLINSTAKFPQGAPATQPLFSAPAAAVRRAAHRTLVQVSCNIDRQRFNVCVAHIYAFARTLEAVVADSSELASPDLKFAAREAAEIIVQLFHPMMPHLAEECWAALGHGSLLATQAWPALQADLLVADAVTLPVHVNGRRRADVTVARDARNGDIEASVLALDAVRRALDGKTPRKVIIVPQRIINVVA
jgi:leucyl-tRNA synthetase